MPISSRRRSPGAVWFRSLPAEGAVAGVRDGGGRRRAFPDVRAHFYLNGAAAHVIDVAGKPGPVPGEVDEGDAAMSVNAMVPGWLIQPGLEMVVEIDPNGEVDESVNMARRIPGEGRIEVNVTEMPELGLTVIPWLWPKDPEEEILDLMRGISAESEVFHATRTLLPVGEVGLTVHEPVYTTTNSGFEIPYEVQALRAIEGGSGYYMALTAQVDRDRGVPAWPCAAGGPPGRCSTAASSRTNSATT